MTSDPIDVLVIGSGPAGMAAAIQAKTSGSDRVLLVERAEELGGLLSQCIHNGFGLIYFNEDMTGPEYGQRFVEKVMDSKIEVLLETMVLRLTPDRKVTLCNRDGVETLNPKSVVLAMGCRERTRESIVIPGYRPAGIFTAGTAQRWVNIEGYLPGKEIVILGSGDVGMIMARRLTLEGARVKAVVEILPYIGGLIRNEVQCLYDFNIPVLVEHTVVNIHGTQRVSGVTVARVDQNRNPISGTEKSIDCDTLLLSVGLIPENELSFMAGVNLDPITGGPILNERMETNLPGIFAAGNCVHVNDLVDNVTLEGEKAGQSAAEHASGKASPKMGITLEAGGNVRYVIPQMITGQREVAIRLRVKEPEKDVILKVGELMTKRLKVVKPSEMLHLILSEKHLKRIKKGTAQLVVNCQKEG
ncbi:MAG: NAD(P)/FAD-dependent oxidoreductase [Methanomicrobiales archaeon]|nr:NAD(P)/FAD-dependent oxidoreductase [Methanomicrobiales archaeon]